jgi:hypothetical protein
MNLMCVYHSEFGACTHPRPRGWRAIARHRLSKPKRREAKFRKSGRVLVTLNRRIHGVTAALGSLQGVTLIAPRVSA